MLDAAHGDPGYSEGGRVMPENPACYFCGRDAQPEHTPCCSSTFHQKPVCCEHYCRGHFVEVNRCSPATHEAAAAVSVTTKEP